MLLNWMQQPCLLMGKVLSKPRLSSQIVQLMNLYRCKRKQKISKLYRINRTGNRIKRINLKRMLQYRKVLKSNLPKKTLPKTKLSNKKLLKKKFQRKKLPKRMLLKRKIPRKIPRKMLLKKMLQKTILPNHLPQTTNCYNSMLLHQNLQS